MLQPVTPTQPKPPTTPRLPKPTQKNTVPASPPKIHKTGSVDSTPTISSVVGDDSEDATSTSVQGTPRQSGSMVTHHDDVVTRMKNIEMIELGRTRIKPWYFAPYPQVSHQIISVKI